MGNLEKIIYAPLMEEESDDVTGWDKDTVRYAEKNRSKIERQIRAAARGLRKTGLQAWDVEDIYGEVILYLHKCHDYDISRAIDRSSTGNIVSLEGYVNSCIRFVVLRYCSQMASHEKETVSDTVYDGEDKELSIFNTIPDPNSEIDIDNMACDFPTLCKSCEPLRYRFGPDIYLILYVRLLCHSDITGDIYKNTLNVLGISKKDLSHIDRSSEDAVIVSMVKAINSISQEEAVSTIEKYVYSANLIKQAVFAQMM